MGNLGGGEILVIMLVALLVLGPSKLPDAARQLGKAVAEFRKVSGGFQRELRAALEVEPEPTPAAKVPSGMPEARPTSGAAQDDARPTSGAAGDEAGQAELQVKGETDPADHTDPTP